MHDLIDLSLKPDNLLTNTSRLEVSIFNDYP